MEVSLEAHYLLDLGITKEKPVRNRRLLWKVFTNGDSTFRLADLSFSNIIGTISFGFIWFVIPIS